MIQQTRKGEDIQIGSEGGGAKTRIGNTQGASWRNYNDKENLIQETVKKLLSALKQTWIFGEQIEGRF